ncbi:hypothetical protein M446_2878 [Methylobacterium sp. 4-46]|nr:MULTISPECIES: hypothetical protein [Methylobacterium]ACA17300.1 hypothetical protein M446_2878 [Methylobacterium sp. 4-46]WFT82987.1 hypothetical protein QA634_14600 [Methylobacterium nodulans]
MMTALAAQSTLGLANRIWTLRVVVRVIAAAWANAPSSETEAAVAPR